MAHRARHCLGCGSRLTAARIDGRARRRCGRCGWIFYDNPVPAAGAIIERAGRILLTRRARPPYAGAWDLPGGFIEAGEHPGRALRRELREELGVSPRAVRFAGFYMDAYGPGGVPLLAIVYTAQITGRPRAASDVSEVAWFPRRRLPFRAVGFPSLRRALREYVRRAPALRGAPCRPGATRGVS